MVSTIKIIVFCESCGEKLKECYSSFLTHDDVITIRSPLCPKCTPKKRCEWDNDGECTYKTIVEGTE